MKRELWYALKRYVPAPVRHGYRRFTSFYPKYRTMVIESKWYRKLLAPGYDDAPIDRALTQYYVDGDTPMATWSLDHQKPHGSVREQYYFLHYLLAKAMQELCSPRSWIDLGCGVGSLSLQVARLGIDDVLAVEGSDIPLKSGLVRFCHANYIVADVTMPLQIRRAGGERATFDVVSAMELLEHIPDERHGMLFDNIRSCRPTWVLLSIGLQPEPYHVNLKSMQKWIKTVSQLLPDYSYNHGLSERVFRRCRKHPHLVDLCPANHLPEGRKLLIFVRNGRFTEERQWR